MIDPINQAQALRWKADAVALAVGSYVDLEIGEIGDNKLVIALPFGANDYLIGNHRFVGGYIVAFI